MIKILAIQLDMLGSKAFSLRVREYFKNSDKYALYSKWFHEDRGLIGRAAHFLIAWQFPVNAISKRHLDLRRTRVEWVYSWVAGRLVNREVKKCSYDILYFHTQTVSYGAIKHMKKIPSILSIDMTLKQSAREPQKKQHVKWTYSLSYKMEQRSFDNAKHIVAISNWARQSLIQEYGLPEQKITVIPPGLNLENFPIVEKQRDNNNLVQILFVGGDFIRKGGDLLLEVFIEYFSEKAILHLVTNEKLRVNHENIIIHPDIHADTPEWHALYAMSDFFVLPTRFDAFGLVFAEAMAYSLPVIGTNVGAIPEIIKNGFNGFLIPPDNKKMLHESMKKLVIDSALRIAMGRNARKTAEEKYDMKVNLRQLEEIMEKVTLK
ncbi:glycosyltransferase family 4 protein [Acidithiobacillus thiooxidans]|uniref:Capsular polysaccharide biosynthesis glycosyltransferase CapM n=1 Tax=Acidithiobacillus thiooxidans ATCC 19377 TaxID=637390 RepID=A0A543Q4E8_ACITH|nr:glycosyltransferase family 4 protein [Acidithiobacillus thiooxidans]MDR7925523.1 glycosyltransferase family 4 protein [Acidithiobacillus thiooxidans]MDX5934683.1 glycosyltransferase family 4 protein [Acidithiobacillus thiooxidans]TQN51194.1 Capsular polysaccharide biosynthesis glycosyltransferase CapM [Acidithiobacillus thiooxidans ATCC 19377]